jgi:hypothetical protein
MGHKEITKSAHLIASSEDTEKKKERTATALSSIVTLRLFIN